jgi:hypothetical protein
MLDRVTRAHERHCANAGDDSANGDDEASPIEAMAARIKVLIEK